MSKLSALRPTRTVRHRSLSSACRALVLAAAGAFTACGVLVLTFAPAGITVIAVAVDFFISAAAFVAVFIIGGMSSSDWSGPEAAGTFGIDGDDACERVP